MEAVTTERLFVRWDAELQEAVNRLIQREGFSAAARALYMPERHLTDLRGGFSRSGFKDGRRTRRKFLSLPLLHRLVSALDETELEEREALTQREWSDRGEWLYRSET
jgi:hypothetical protein